ncbi:nickel transporter permease [Anaerovorax odorimutans]|uniref:nickel transporter permease n=1 Tax=Anaerovorax odorimutans TaxID=109327 RepID=UPI000404C062|nr:nickel transporter permease [Anaerovorax odorimutans]
MTLFKNKLALIGLVIIVIIAIGAVFAPLIAPNNPNEQILEQALKHPSIEYPFGTDEFGRCIFSRVLYGSRISLQIGVTITFISSVIGITLGLISGFYGGVIDEIIMRIVDIFLAFPGLILALVVAGLLGPGRLNVIIALSLVGWMGYARVVRGVVLSEKEKEFVENARSLGASDLYIIYHHMLPNVINPVIIMASIGVGYAILSAAGLSFLGIGVQPPTPEWGSMLSSGKVYIQTSPHLTIFPGIAIMITVLAFNFLGDGLRDYLDPRSNIQKIE